MQKLILCMTLLAVSLGAQAADERTASAIVKKYSETVACQITELADQKNQYKAVKIDPGMADMDGFGAKFVVFWQGDMGCSGGNGTAVPQFTVVEQSGFMSVPPTVMPDYKFPLLEIVHLTNMSVTKNGLLLLTGVTYGPKDQQHIPTKVVKYSLKLVGYEFIKQ